MNNNNNIKLTGSENFSLWIDHILWVIRKEELIDYVTTDKIGEIDIDHPSGPNEITTVMNNGKARVILVESMTPQVHSEVVGINSAYNMLEKLKKKYGGDDNNIAYWVRTLNSLSASDETEIMDVLDKMNNIFKTMEKKKLILSENDKLRYVYHSIPRSYLGKFELNDKDDFESLYNRIDKDLSRISFIDNWKEKNRFHEPMEIDYIIKESNNNINNQNNLQNNYDNKNYNKHKYCDICKMNNHNTDDCRFNLKNKNKNKSKFKNINYNRNNNYFNNSYNNKNKNYYNNNNNNNSNKKGIYYTGFIPNDDINNYYNSNVGFHDIKAMFLEKEKHYSINNNNCINNDNYVNNNKNLNKGQNIKKYYNNICSVNLNNKSNVSFDNLCNKSVWLYDSGAGEHLTNNKRLLINYKEEQSVLTCANGSNLIFEGYGEFHGFINNHRITFKRVLYSKDVSRNIISGIELAKMDIKAITEKDKDNSVHLQLYDKYNKCIGTFTANKQNEIQITTLHDNYTKENFKKYIFNINKLNK